MAESKHEDKLWAKQPRKVTYVDTPKPRIDMSTQNALFVFLKKQKSTPEVRVHKEFLALQTPYVQGSFVFFDAELQYSHQDRPGSILRVPMEVMMNIAKIYWCKLDNWKVNQPLPDMSRELLVLFAENIRSETVATQTTIPGIGNATFYKTTLNKADGSQAVSEAVCIHGAHPTEDVD